MTEHETVPARGSLDYYANKYAESDLDLNPHRTAILKNTCDDLLKDKARYQAVERMTNVPWYMVGAINYRESSFNFSSYLGNGDPLSQKTHHVPAGRGPFTSWESGAVDALEYDGLSGRTNWSLPLCLQLAEKYNGMGYFKFHPNNPSPYVWAYLSFYRGGLYTADGHFNPNSYDQRPGVAAIFKWLQSVEKL